MKLHFEPLEHQHRAAQSVVGVFADCAFAPNLSAPELGNPVCDYEQAVENIAAYRDINGIAAGRIIAPDYDNGPLNLDVMMETGTGKTFTFIDTIYRLNREYGLSKFIILVPSNAIRAGTLKNLAVTREFFAGYGRMLAAYNYNETTIGGFVGASNKKINVLVTSFASFNKVNNIIRKKKLERNLVDRARTYMDAIAKLRPVIIIDEPHRADGKRTQENLPRFNAQIILRYGATFGGGFCNLVYALDSASAFRRGLVKSITVSGVSLTADDTLEYRRQNGGGVVVWTSTVDGRSKSQKAAVREGDNLGDKFKNTALNGYVVEKTLVRGVRFDNGHFLPANTADSCSELRGEVRKEILRAAVRKHLQKEHALFARGIKALALFFIDDVGAYLTNDNADGKLAKMFDAIYDEERAAALKSGGIGDDYRQYLQAARGKEVRGGYFAKSNKNKDNEAEIDLILRNKEKLLSFAEPTRFIFSKWALREGWDNPNIFTLAKLAPSNSEITKLQQIGRGLRLPVNQDGRRIPASEMAGVLDVIVPGKEEEFVLGIQKDIDEASFGERVQTFNNRMLRDLGICPSERSANAVIDGLAQLKVAQVDDDYNATIIAAPGALDAARDDIAALAKKAEANAGKLLDLLALQSKAPKAAAGEKHRREEMAEIRKEQFAKFKDAWQRINSRAVITYDIDTPQLIRNAAEVINEELNIKSVSIEISQTERAENAEAQLKRAPRIQSICAIGKGATLGELMDNLAAATKLTRHTIAAILGKINRRQFDAVKKNPKQAARDIAHICIGEVHAMVCQKIRYDIVETRIKDTSLTDDRGEPRDNIKASELGRYLLKIANIGNAAARDKFLYGNAAGYDSGIEEQTIQKSGISAVTVFAKLPRVNIKTPVGEYNPDFAFVVNTGGGKELYLVLETKGYDNDDGDMQREREQRKTQCAESFFAALNARWPDSGVKITYRKVFNQDDMASIIAEMDKAASPPAGR